MMWHVVGGRIACVYGAEAAVVWSVAGAVLLPQCTQAGCKGYQNLPATSAPHAILFIILSSCTASTESLESSWSLFFATLPRAHHFRSMLAREANSTLPLDPSTLAFSKTVLPFTTSTSYETSRRTPVGRGRRQLHHHLRRPSWPRALSGKSSRGQRG